nr:orf159EGC115 [uncultured bacterium]
MSTGNLTETALASRILRHLLVGEKPSGLRFGTAQILFHSGPSKPIGEPYINLASAWCVFPSRPEHLPLTEADVPATTTSEDEYQLIISLRDRTVVDVEVCHPIPHLLVTFDDHSVLYINGHNDQYEAWQAGQSFSEDEMWLVVACPGDSIAIWAPERF